MRRCIAAAALAAGCVSANAQTIYPLDRAEILSGSRFDLKVEVPLGEEQSLSVTINGEPIEARLGRTAEHVSREEGQAHSAFWLRDVELSEPGRYEIVASTPTTRSTVTWEVYKTPRQTARNIILFVGDGLSVAHRTAARILSKGLREGRYQGKLAMDDMDRMAIVATAGTDSVITDSANGMSAYTTGHKSCVGAMGIYCARNVSPYAHPRVETISSLAKRLKDMSVGIVTTAEVTDATPAAMVAHTRKRTEMAPIVRMLLDAKPDVLLGGGRAFFLPKDLGGKRDDGIDYMHAFATSGYALAATRTELHQLVGESKPQRLLGLFHEANIDGALDRKFFKGGTVAKYPDQPDLVEMTTAALETLSRAPGGFLLMVESARIDKYSHSLDWERAVYDTIMLDNAIAKAKEFADARKDTLVIVVADHAHPISLVGVFDDARPGETPRTKLGVYEKAGFPNYPPADAEGYPPTPDVSRRLAMLFGAYPDHCFGGRPNRDQEFQPATQDQGGSSFVANEANCRPGTVRLFGNLPFDAPQGVHAGDDVILTAMGPGADVFKGQIDNTFVFRAIASALGLSPLVEDATR